MRVLLLTQFFDPEPTLKGMVLARELRRQGFDVEVLTGFPNYPGGRIYEGYRRRLWQREVIDGIRIHRVWLYPSHDLSPIRRILNYVSFAVAAALLGPWLIRKPDVMYVYHPPPTISLAASVIRAVFGTPYLYEVQDIWPDTVAATGMLRSSLLLKILGAWVNRVYRGADHVSVISPGFRRLLIERGMDAARVDVVYNWCDEDRMRLQPSGPELATALGFNGRFNVLFAGTMGLAQALDPVLDAAERLRERLPHVQFVFVGGGVERARLQHVAARRELTNVRFIPAQPLDRMGAILPLADALLVHLKDDPLFAITVPSKTQAYLFAGVPIIMAVRGDGADLVRSADAGVVCNPEDPDDICRAVERLASMPAAERMAMGARGRHLYDERLSVAVGGRRYAQLLTALASRKK